VDINDFFGKFILLHQRDEMIEIFLQLFRRRRRDETIPTKMKPFSVFGANVAKPGVVITPSTTTADRRPIQPAETIDAHAQLRPCFRLPARRFVAGRFG
jgi:hypothetical protein